MNLWPFQLLASQMHQQQQQQQPTFTTKLYHSNFCKVVAEEMTWWQKCQLGDHLVKVQMAREENENAGGQRRK